MAGQGWTTAGLPPEEQFPYWRDVVWDAFVPVAVHRESEGQFLGSVTGGKVGPLGLYFIQSERQSVTRTASLVRDAPGDVYFLNLPLSRGSSASQGGRDVQLSSGDFTVVDSREPFELQFREDFRQISVTIPCHLLGSGARADSPRTAVAVAGGSGVGGVLAALIRSLVRHGSSLDRLSAAEAARSVCGLLTLALSLDVPTEPKGSREVLLRAVMDEAERSLADPTLGPSVLAARVGLSTRYLHRLFADEGVTFGRWLLRTRLDRCRDDLLDPSRMHVAIAEIASRRGLPDPSYFSRVFKQRFGQTPRELRRSSWTASRSRTPGESSTPHHLSCEG